MVMQPLPQTRFAPARGARLAYQLFGAGEQTVVAIPPTAQNIEMSWEQPAVHAMLERFASFCRYLHFDKRGTGCSDRSGRIADLDERVDDLRAVIDHAGIEHAHLSGNSEGGPMTLVFAATYPERVDSLILSGTGATRFLRISVRRSARRTAPASRATPRGGAPRTHRSPRGWRPPSPPRTPPSLPGTVATNATPPARTR